MSETHRDCEHGQLARKCYICELEQELAAVTAERDEARAELARALRVVEAAKELAANCEEYEFDDGIGYAAPVMWWHDLDNALDEWEAGR